jgi:hypothetical protein
MCSPSTKAGPEHTTVAARAPRPVAKPSPAHGPVAKQTSGQRPVDLSKGKSAGCQGPPRLRLDSRESASRRREVDRLQTPTDRAEQVPGVPQCRRWCLLGASLWLTLAPADRATGASQGRCHRRLGEPGLPESLRDRRCCQPAPATRSPAASGCGLPRPRISSGNSPPIGMLRILAPMSSTVG